MSMFDVHGAEPADGERWTCDDCGAEASLNQRLCGPCAQLRRDAFRCHVCGTECDIAPPPPGKAVCPDHCEDHDYQYEPGDGHRCVHCNIEPPDDWFDID